MGRISDADCARLGLDDTQRAAHRASTVIDLHVDCIIQQRLFGYDIRAEHDVRWHWHWSSLRYDVLRAGARMLGRHQPYFNHADIPRMRRGGYDAVALSAHTWPAQSERGWTEIKRQLAYLREVLADDDTVLAAHRPADVRRAASEGKLALIAAVEGLHALGSSGKKNETRRLDRIEQLYDHDGVRYITLAHLCANDAARHGFGPGSNQRDGLSAFGREVVRKMNEVGMMIDVAHLNQRCVLDVCSLTRSPVLATHSGLVGARDSHGKRYVGRLLHDDALRAIADTGGIVGVMFAPYFLSNRREGLRCVTRHLSYAREYLDAAGFDGVAHLAVGSDLDGWISSIPEDIDDAADMPRLTAALLDTGFSPQEVTLIWGENFLRLWECATG